MSNTNPNPSPAENWSDIAGRTLKNVLRIEPISRDEVQAADRMRWRERTLARGFGEGPYEEKVKPDALFQGPDAASAGLLLDALYDRTLRGKEGIGTPLCDGGPTPASILGHKAGDKIEKLWRALSRRNDRLVKGERRHMNDGSVTDVYRITDAAIVRDDPTANVTWLHLLPFVHKKQIAEVPGLGTFVLQGVGSTAYSTGLFVYFHREGEEEALRGHLDYKATVDEDFRLDWKRGIALPSYRQTTAEEEGWTPDVIAAADPIVRNLANADAVVWMFQFCGAIGMEFDPWERRRRQDEFALRDYREMKDGKRRLRDNTTPEGLDRLIAGYERDLRRSDEKMGRMAGLKAVRTTISAWIDEGRNGGERRPATEMMEEATAAALAASQAASQRVSEPASSVEAEEDVVDAPSPH